VEKNEVEKKLRTIVTAQLCVDDNKVVGTANFINDLGADSLDIVEIIMTAEEDFDIEIKDEDAEKCLTFAEAVEFIHKNVNE